MEHYKSWAGLNQWLQSCLCEQLHGRIRYFLTRYHKVHDSYGRAAILLDGRELVCFSWIEQYRQEQTVAALHAQDRSQDWVDLYDGMQSVWEESGTLCEWDFLDAVLKFRNLSIQDALRAQNLLIRTLAILDKRVGKRTLQKIRQDGAYKQLPAWARQFYELRLEECESITK